MNKLLFPPSTAIDSQLSKPAPHLKRFYKVGKEHVYLLSCLFIN